MVSSVATDAAGFSIGVISRWLAPDRHGKTMD
jgi:hypothetical protein